MHERTRSMSSVATTKNCGGWKSSPTPPHNGGWKSSPTPLDNGNWGKNPKQFFGVFDTLIDRCTLVVWAVANSQNRNNWRSTSIKNYPKVLTTIAHFAKQPARDVYFVRQTRTSEQNSYYDISQSHSHSFNTNGEHLLSFLIHLEKHTYYLR